MDAPAQVERERRILSLWERAVGRPRWQRDEALLAEVGAPGGLGERNRALLAIRNALFAGGWQLRGECPCCGAECSFGVDCVALADDLDRQMPRDAGARFAWRGEAIAVRAPVADDLRDIDMHEDVADAARALAVRCLPAGFQLSELSEEEFEALDAWMESLDPAAAVAFSLACPACAHAWTPPVDLADALWAELQRAAERTLIEVDALARAYGWTEEQVFGLSPARRAAYLQLVAAS